MVSPGNRHCASCIGALWFPLVLRCRVESPVPLYTLNPETFFCKNMTEMYDKELRFYASNRPPYCRPIHCRPKPCNFFLQSMRLL